MNKIKTVMVVIASSAALLYGEQLSSEHAEAKQVIAIKLKQFPQNTEFANQSTADIQSELQKQEVVAGTRYEVSYQIQRLRLELAKRGDRNERERIFQTMKGPNSRERFRALDDAGRIGDREAVYHLAELLNDPDIYHWSPPRPLDEPIMTQNRPMFGPPRMKAALKLAQLIENPPVPPVGQNKKYYTDEDVKIWQKWWQEHKAEFKEFWDVQELLDEEEKSQETTLEEVLPVVAEEPVSISVAAPTSTINTTTNLELAPSTIANKAEQSEKTSLSKVILWISVFAFLVIVGGVVVWKNKP